MCGVDAGQFVLRRAAYRGTNDEGCDFVRTGAVTMRDILVYANSFEVWSQSVRYAARLAAATQATLTAAYVYPTPELMMPAFGAPALLAEIVTQTRKIERESLAAEQRFVAWAQDLGVARAAWQVAEGYLPEALGQLGNWHDVLVLERSGDIAWESAADLGTLVVQTGLPCLIVPPDEYDPARLDCVALAWNGAPEGLRAIHAALPVLKMAKRVVLLSGHRRDPLYEIGWRPPFEIESHLERHGIRFEPGEISASDAGAGEAILRAAAARNADLLVMGAYGRNRFSEWVFGGATRHVLEHAKLPVLMRH
jgi:nucleotide-binding universal stress UspA family protein